MKASKDRSSFPQDRQSLICALLVRKVEVAAGRSRLAVYLRRRSQTGVYNDGKQTGVSNRQEQEQKQTLMRLLLASSPYLAWF
jgi:hypothetical protein